MGQRFCIEGELPALNEIISASKSHWAAYRKHREAALRRTRIFIRRARLRPFSPDVRIWITTTYYAPNRRKDPANLAAGAHKIFEDALQHEGVLVNDGYRTIAGYTERFCVDAKKPRIEVELCEVLL